MKALPVFLLLPFILFSQQESFKITFNHQALPLIKLQVTGDFYIKTLGFKEIEMTANQYPLKRWLKNHEGKQLHLINSDAGVPNTIINHMAFSTKKLESVVKHLRKNNLDYWTDEGKKNIVRIRKDGVRQIKIQDPEGQWIEINEVN